MSNKSPRTLKMSLAMEDAQVTYVTPRGRQKMTLHTQSSQEMKWNDQVGMVSRTVNEYEQSSNHCFALIRFDQYHWIINNPIDDNKLEQSKAKWFCQ